jgi:hypothetical protein
MLLLSQYSLINTIITWYNYFFSLTDVLRVSLYWQQKRNPKTWGRPTPPRVDPPSSLGHVFCPIKCVKLEWLMEQTVTFFYCGIGYTGMSNFYYRSPNSGAVLFLGARWGRKAHTCVSLWKKKRLWRRSPNPGGSRKAMYWGGASGKSWPARRIGVTKMAPDPSRTDRCSKTPITGQGVVSHEFPGWNMEVNG